MRLWELGWAAGQGSTGWLWGHSEKVTVPSSSDCSSSVTSGAVDGHPDTQTGAVRASSALLPQSDAWKATGPLCRDRISPQPYGASPN